MQLGLALAEPGGWGGKRPGAGRPRVSPRPLVPHRQRPTISANHPVHVTLRVRDHVWNLRSRRSFRVIETALLGVRVHEGFAVNHFSVQGNHIHMIVEANDAAALATGIKALSLRIARGMNRMMQRRGAVFADRYHGHVLETPREVRNALAYVLLNHRSHRAHAGERAPSRAVDRFSTAPAFDGWRESETAPAGQRPRSAFATVPPRSWLLRTGWRRRGLIDTSEVPAVSATQRRTERSAS